MQVGCKTDNAVLISLGHLGTCIGPSPPLLSLHPPPSCGLSDTWIQSLGYQLLLYRNSHHEIRIRERTPNLTCQLPASRVPEGSSRRAKTPDRKSRVFHFEKSFLSHSSSCYIVSEPLYQVKLLTAFRNGDVPTVQSFLSNLSTYRVGAAKSTSELPSADGTVDIASAALHLAIRCAPGSSSAISIFLCISTNVIFAPPPL